MQHFKNIFCTADPDHTDTYLIVEAVALSKNNQAKLIPDTLEA